MKRKQIIDLVTAGLILILSSACLMFNSLIHLKVIYLLLGVVGICCIMGFIKLFMCPNRVNTTFYIIFNALVFLLLMILDYKNPTNLMVILFIWTILMGFISLNEDKKERDNNKSIWIAKILLLLLFMVSGLLTIITLYDNAVKPIIEIGYFFYIYGIIKLASPVSELLLQK